MQGLIVRSYTKDAGITVNNAYGIYLESQTIASNNYSIYTNDGPVHFGDDVDLASGKVYKVNTTQVLGAQGAAVADASGGTVVDIEARAAINSLLARLRAHGAIAT